MCFLFLFVKFDSLGMQKACILVHLFVIRGDMIYILIVLNGNIFEGKFLGIIVRNRVF